MRGRKHRGRKRAGLDFSQGVGAYVELERYGRRSGRPALSGGGRQGGACRNKQNGLRLRRLVQQRGRRGGKRRGVFRKILPVQRRRCSLCKLGCPRLYDNSRLRRVRHGRRSANAYRRGGLRQRFRSARARRKLRNKGVYVLVRERRRLRRRVHGLRRPQQDKMVPHFGRHRSLRLLCRRNRLRQRRRRLRRQGGTENLAGYPSYYPRDVHSRADGRKSQSRNAKSGFHSGLCVSQLHQACERKHSQHGKDNFFDRV